MYYDLETKAFYESKQGKVYLTLKRLNVNLGEEVNLLDNFYEDKIRVVEIIKDIENICDDLKDNTSKFDYRRKELLIKWINNDDISMLLPLGHKASLKALAISYELAQLLNDLNDEHREYIYLVTIYLKELFKKINELKGVSVER